MNNIDKVSMAFSQWAYNIAQAVLPSFSVPKNSAAAKMLMFLGVDPATYSIWKELGFLAEPMIQTLVTPMAHKLLDGIPDDQVPELAKKFVEAFKTQAQEKGSVNVFGLELGPKSFDSLAAILAEKMSEGNGTEL